MNKDSVSVSVSVRILFNDVILGRARTTVRNVPSIRAFGEALAGLCKHLAIEIPPYITVMARYANMPRTLL